MFCYILGESAVDKIFYSSLHLNFYSFLGFRHGSGSSVKAIMPLSAVLLLAIGFKCFWFLIALLLYPKSTVPNQFSKGSWQNSSVSTTWCQRRNWIASMI